ncbi:MAG: hypothetical protein NZ902_06285 [Acidilobaceae archaeon]|nr:hypothetical protein [Acidilobaceae archaeon]MCX8166183.1 hypothetical protein [Acidilobaceae archaeon]MDW7974821.1 hypothetical protein [Sulfolobales archaeon]
MLPLASVFVAGFVMSFLFGKGLTSFAFVGGLLAYILISYTSPSLRYYPLALLVGIHVGAVLTYYTKPLPLPFLIVEMSPFGAAINVDLVQVLLAYELATHYFSRRSRLPMTQPVGGSPGPALGESRRGVDDSNEKTRMPEREAGG